MLETLSKILIISYLATAFIDIIGYWPTIMDLWRRKKPSANIKTFSLWAFTSGITFLYSIFILPDLFFRLVSGIILACNILILILRIRLRPKFYG